MIDISQLQTDRTGKQFKEIKREWKKKIYATFPSNWPATFEASVLLRAETVSFFSSFYFILFYFINLFIPL